MGCRSQKETKSINSFHKPHSLSKASQVFLPFMENKQVLPIRLLSESTEANQRPQKLSLCFILILSSIQTYIQVSKAILFIHSTVLKSRSVLWCANSVSDINHKVSSFPCKFICSSFRSNQPTVILFNFLSLFKSFYT